MASKLRRQLAAALRTGTDLAEIERELSRGLLTFIVRRDLQRRKHGAALMAAKEVDVRYLYSITSMQRLRLDVAEQELERIAALHPMVYVLRLRLAILRRTPIDVTERYASDDDLDALLVSDTAAQVALARGSASVALAETDVTLATKARVFATCAREPTALELMHELAPSARDELMRAFPADPATRLWALQGAAPYR